MGVFTPTYLAVSLFLLYVLAAPALAGPPTPIDQATLDPYIYLSADTGVTTVGATVSE